MIPIILKKDGYKMVTETKEIEKPPDHCIIVGKKVVLRDFNSLYEHTKETEYFDEEKIGALFHYKPIPYEIYYKALSFFRKVYKELKTEANVLLVSKTGEEGYRILVPKQKTGSVSVDYEIEQNDLKEGEYISGSIHSHPNFSAHQSSTDHDETDIGYDGIHITIGKINDPQPEIHQRVSIGGETYESKTPLIETSPKMDFDVPKEWMDRIEEETFCSNSPFSYNNYEEICEQYGWRGKKKSKKIKVKDKNNKKKEITEEEYDSDKHQIDDKSILYNLGLL